MLIERERPRLTTEGTPAAQMSLLDGLAEYALTGADTIEKVPGRVDHLPEALSAGGVLLVGTRTERLGLASAVTAATQSPPDKG